jgi:hypothetical protein
LKYKQVKLLIHTPFTQSLKQSGPVYFPKILASLKPSWSEPCRPLNHWPQMTGISSVPEEEDISPWNHISAQPVPCRDQSTPAPIMTTPGVPTRHMLQVSVSLHQSEGLVLGSSASFSRLEGDPRITSHWGCTLPGSRNLCRLQGQGAGTCCPMGHDSLILLRPSKCCRNGTESVTDQRE